MHVGQPDTRLQVHRRKKWVTAMCETLEWLGENNPVRLGRNAARIRRYSRCGVFFTIYYTVGDT